MPPVVRSIRRSSVARILAIIVAGIVSSTCAGDRSRTPGAPEPADATSGVKLTGSAFDVPPNRAPVMNRFGNQALMRSMIMGMASR